MKDNLEKFIQEHRDEFDPYEPPEQVWQAIDKQLRPGRRRIQKVYYAIAASVLLIAGAFIWFGRHTVQNKALPVNTAVDENPEIKNAEFYYASMVAEERTQLSHFAKDYPDMFKDFDGEIDTLRLLYGQLKTEYINSNGNEAVSQALIENLQMQVQLLSKQLQIIQEIRQREGKKGRNYKLM